MTLEAIQLVDGVYLVQGCSGHQGIQHQLSPGCVFFEVSSELVGVVENQLYLDALLRALVENLGHQKTDRGALRQRRRQQH